MHKTGFYLGRISVLISLIVQPKPNNSNTSGLPCFKRVRRPCLIIQSTSFYSPRHLFASSITVCGLSLAISFKLLATLNRTFLAGSFLRFSKRGMMGVGGSFKFGKAIAHGRRGRQSSDASRLTPNVRASTKLAFVL